MMMEEFDEILQEELSNLLKSTYHEDIESINSLGGFATALLGESVGDEVDTAGELLAGQIMWEEERRIRKEKAKYVLGGSNTSEKLQDAVERVEEQRARKRRLNRKLQGENRPKKKKKKKKKTATNLRQKVYVH